VTKEGRSKKIRVLNTSVLVAAESTLQIDGRFAGMEMVSQPDVWADLHALQG